jgi:hypothetical protein
MGTKHHKIDIPYCSHCGSTTNTLIKYSKVRNNKQLYYCNICNTERLKKYRKTQTGIINTRKAVSRYESINIKRKKAWNKVNKQTLKPCIICGKLPTHRHHPDINKPLEVIFLCPYHHKQADKQLMSITL